MLPTTRRFGGASATITRAPHSRAAGSARRSSRETGKRRSMSCGSAIARASAHGRGPPSPPGDRASRPRPSRASSVRAPGGRFGASSSSRRAGTHARASGRPVKRLYIGYTSPLSAPGLQCTRIQTPGPSLPEDTSRPCPTLSRFSPTASSITSSSGRPAARWPGPRFSWSTDSWTRPRPGTSWLPG